MRTFLYAQQTPWAVDNDMTKLAADPLPYQPAASRSWMRRTARAMLLVLLTQTVLPVFAQSLPLTANTQAPAGQRPILDAAGNGVPIVHIAPPSAAGVSRNQYDQFNVNTNGLILNNSAANVQTTQGGWISGNPQLGVTPARIILNEVVSTHASQLRGTIEVAGRRADIVVANPNGIACDGCGFLNSGRATLTTGRPQFGGDGALNGFDVRQGELNIGTGGLNASNLEQLDLIARGIVIEGEVWAKNLNAIAGGNQVLYGTLHSTAQGTAGTAPKFAIDIKSVGGMYANQIYMIGTEQGLGVNSAGRVAALQGNLVLSANGDLTLKDSYAKQSLQVASTGNIALSGQTVSDGVTTITSTGNLTQQGVIDSQNALSINAAGLRNTGDITQRSTDTAALTISGSAMNSGTIFSAGKLHIDAADITDNGGKLLAAGDLALRSRSIVLTDTTLTTDSNAVLTASTGNLSANNVNVYAGGNLTVGAAGQIVNAGGTWQAVKNVVLNGRDIDNRDGEILANQVLTVTTTGGPVNGLLDNRGGMLIGNAGLTIDSGEIRNAKGTLATGAELAVNIQTAQLDNTEGLIVGNGAVSLVTGKLVNTKGAIASNAATIAIDTHANDLLNDEGKIQALGNTVIQAAMTDNHSGVISGADIGLAATQLNNAGGQIVADGGLDAITAALNNRGGLLQAAGDMTIDTQGATLDNSVSGSNGGIIGGGTLTLSAGSLDNRSGYIASGLDQTLTLAGTLDNRVDTSTGGQPGGVIVSNGKSTTMASTVLNTGGVINALGDIAITSSGTTDNRGGTIASNNGVKIAASLLDNSKVNTVAGTIDGKAVELSASTVNNLGGTIRSTEDMALATAALDNTSGMVSSARDLALSATAFNNNSGKVVGGRAAVVGTSSRVLAGSIASVENLTLNVSGDYVNSGIVSAEKNLAVNAANINNSGTLNAGENLTANTGSLTNSGEISAANTQLNVTGTLVNTATGLIDGTTTAINANTVTNTGRIFGDLLKVQADTLNNSGTGVIAARNKLLIGARNVNNTDGGLLYSLGDIAMAGSFDGNLNAVGEVQKLVNGSAKIEAANNIRLAVKDLINRNDGLVTRTETTSIPVNRLLIQRYASSDLTKYDASELGWVSPSPTVGRHGGYALPSTKYPFATFGSNLKDDAFLYNWEDGSIGGVRYAANDPIWALMGVAPPQSSDLSPVALAWPLTFNGFIDCVNIEPTVCRDYQTWQQRVMTQNAALNAKITAFNNDLNSRSFNDWYEDTITRQDITETVVDSTRPAQILAGGAISVASSGSVLNDNSNIVAGGAIGITGATIENRGTEGTKAVTDVGTRIVRYVATFGNGGDLHMGTLGPITGAPVVTTKTLQAFVYKPNAANPTASRNLATNTTTANAELAAASSSVANQSISTTGKAVDVPLSASAQAQLAGQTINRDWTVPNNSLFTVNATPGAKYLVETDPRFTSKNSFLSSDYYLASLNRDPERQLKRYGDGFVEQQMVNDQILALTGRRYLSGYTNTEAEYKSLMDAGIAFAQQYQISPGAALSAEQMALLTTDIVMLVTKTVTLADGSTQDVLVPQVYLRRPQAGDLLPSGGLIAGSDVYIKSAGDLVNSGQIAANNETTLLAGNDLLNRGGRISGQDVYARAGNDLKNISGSIQGTGTGSNVALSAGRDIILETRTIAGQTARTATTAATTRVNADRIATVQGGTVTIEAARDLIGKGSAVQAETDLVAVAGRDIKISAVESSYTYNEKTGSRVTKGRSGYIKEESVTNELATFDAGNNLALVAGASGKGDVTLSGVNATAGSNAVIQGSNVTIEAVKNSKLEDFQTVGYQYYRRDMKSDETVVGGTVSAGDNLTIRATGAPDTTATAGGLPVPLAGSGDVRLTGAYLQSQDGQVSVMANNDVTIDAIKTEHATAFEYYKKTKSLFKTKTITQTNFTNTQQAEGSVISGDSVLIQAGNQVNRTGDVTIKASQVVADNDLQISAGRNLNIETEQVQSRQISTYEKKVSGLFSGGGLSVTIGKQQTNQNGTSQSISHVGSVVGSVGGDVSLSAGNQYRQVGSDVVAPAGDINIAARQVDIGAATDGSNSEQQTKFKQSGLTLAISSPVLSALQTVQQMSQAASKTKDGRMQALAGASAALAVNNGYDAIKAGQGSVINGKENQIATGKNPDGSTASRDANAADKAGGINLSISIGGSKSQSQSMQAETNAVGSNVTAGGDVRIVASGGGADSDLTIEGSNVKAGSNVLLQADDAINLLAAKSTAEQHSSNKSSSGSIGISIGTSGFGVTASASKGRGKADGSDVSWTNTHVEAGNVLAVQSGGDTTLKGAVAQGDRVIAQVGGDLTIESLQDTSKYDSKQQNVGGSVTIGVSGVSGSINYSKSKINSDYASVTEQSGIKAGDGGFQVSVEGNTDLKGAVIASSDQAAQDGRNSLVTGSLTTSDIENRASYSGQSVGIGIGYSTEGKGVGKDQKGNAETGGNQTPGTTLPSLNGFSATLPVVMSASGDADSTTQSGISAANVVITDQARQQALTGKDAATTIASINTAVSTERDGSNTLKPIFNEQEIQAGFEIVGALSREVGTFLNNRAKEAEQAKKEIAERLLNTDDPTEIAALKAELLKVERWDVGGTYRNMVNALAASASGNVTGSSSQMLQGAAVNYLQSLTTQQIKTFADQIGDENVRAALHGITACAGASAQGQSCTGAALGASVSSLINSLLEDASNATSEQKAARSNLLTTFVAGTSLALGGSVTSANTAALIETENNGLFRNRALISKTFTPQIQKLEEAYLKREINEQELLLSQAKIEGAAAKVDALLTIYNASNKLPLSQSLANMKPEHVAMLGEAIAGFLQVPGMAMSAYELVTGKTVSGEEANYFFAAMGVLPAAQFGKAIGKATDLGNALSHMPSVIAAERIAANQAKGISFENAVLEYLSEAKNTHAFTVQVGAKTVTVIPDGILNGEKILEVKNVGYLSNSNQLRAYAELVETGGVDKLDNAVRFQAIELIVNPNTIISDPLKKMIKETGGNIKVFDPVTKTMRTLIL